MYRLCGASLVGELRWLMHAYRWDAFPLPSVAFLLSSLLLQQMLQLPQATTCSVELGGTEFLCMLLNK